MKNIIVCLGVVGLLGACSSLKIDNANNCLPTENEERCKAIGKVVKKTADKAPKESNISVTNKETSSVAEQITNNASNAEEMPSGRTRRRRSAIS